MRQEKRKKKGGEKAKSKSQDCCVTFKPKIVEILLSAHARISQANILLLDQKAAKCTTGLSLRAGGWGFSPATKRVASGFFYWKIEEK